MMKCNNKYYLNMASVWICLLVLSIAMPAAADEVQVTLAESEESARIVFQWPLKVVYSHEVSGREIILKFERPINAVEIGRITRGKFGWIAGVSTGFDTVLLLAGRDVSYTVSSDGNMVIVKLLMVEEGAKKENDASGKLRLALLKSRLLLETGREYEARRFLKELVMKFPQNSSVLVACANIERNFGRFYDAYRFYGRALKAAPENEDAKRGFARLKCEIAPRIRLSADLKKIKGRQREFILGVRATLFVDEDVVAGVEHFRNWLDAGSVFTLDGTKREYSGVRYKSAFYIKKFFDNGSSVAWSLFPNEKDAGFGLTYELRDRRGKTTFNAEIDRANWEYVEGIVNGAVRDMLQIGRQQRFRRWFFTASTAVERFGVADERIIAGAYSAAGTARYLFSSAWPQVSLGYGLDARYAHSVRKRTGAFGSFMPLPVEDKEIHSVDIGYINLLQKTLRFEAYSGYAWDRFGSHGPLAGLLLAYGNPGCREVQLRVEHGRNAVDTNEAVNHISSHVFWQF